MSSSGTSKMLSLPFDGKWLDVPQVAKAPGVARLVGHPVQTGVIEVVLGEWGYRLEGDDTEGVARYPSGLLSGGRADQQVPAMGGPPGPALDGLGAVQDRRGPPRPDAQCFQSLSPVPISYEQALVYHMRVTMASIGSLALPGYIELFRQTIT